MRTLVHKKKKKGTDIIFSSASREKDLEREREREADQVQAMAGLQRSAVSFRRQGSSGLVWDDKFLKELNQESDNNNSKQKEQEQAAAVEISSSQQDQQEQQQQQQQPQVDVKPPRSINTTIERSRSNGGGGARGYRTGRVSPAIEPPSPRVSACGFCSAFANKPPKNNTHAKRTGKRRSRQF